jgi:putative nucleotidyltransferase with HDIG domain
MSKIELLERKVRALYEAKNPGRATDWADWLYAHHVFVVADFAVEVASEVGARADLARAAAMLHDIADVRVKRRDAHHEAESLKIARELMKECDFGDEEIAVVVDDAIALHSCRDGKRPASLEGQVLATADSLAHLKTDFYVHAVWALAKEMTLGEVKAWALKKIPRDYHDKILFDEVRARVKPDYDLLMELFSR